jgi:DNA repair protein RadC
MTGRRRPRRSRTYDGDPQLSFDFFAIGDSAVNVPWEAPIDEPARATTTQLLATLLGPATLPLCRRLLAEHDGLRRMARVFPAELRERGFNRSQISKLTALYELAKRFGEEEFVPGEPFRGSYDVYAHFRERLAEETTERFIAVLLDNKNRKLRDICISQGSLTSSVVHPREVYLPVIRESAAAVIFAHNHPSGDPTPSREDIDLTRRLREVGDLVGVRVLDHIVVGKGRYVSFVDDGYW